MAFVLPAREDRVRNRFRRPDKVVADIRGIGSRHALCGAQPLATAALGVSQALSFFDPAIINLPSLENCERIVALAQSGLEL